MFLADKLASISREQTVFQLNLMLDSARVSSISWSCQRLVSVKGYEGAVDINELVDKYLAACPRAADGINLQERLDFYNLWTKVKRVCKDNESLNDTWVYKYLVPTQEFCYRFLYTKAGSRDLIVTGLKGTKFLSKEELCFQFSSKDFKQLWPNEEPWKIYGDDDVYVATKEMVEAAYKRSANWIDLGMEL